MHDGLVKGVTDFWNQHKSRLETMLGEKDLSLKFHDSYGIDYFYIQNEYHRKNTYTSSSYIPFVAKFALSQFPSCCGMAICHNIQMDGLEREISRAPAISFILDMQVYACREANFNQQIYSTANYQAGIIHALRGGGWAEVNEFKNLNTGRQIKVWIKNVIGL
jgi:hypothetical protein